VAVVSVEFLTLATIASMIRSREISSVEVTSAMLDRIDANRRLGAYVAISETAIDRARHADVAILRGEPVGPLCGVPVSLKDVIDTRELPTSYGSLVLQGHTPTDNASVVDLLEDAGAVVLGKVATAEFATAEHPLIPPPLNPWGDHLWAGLSSNGSGVAVAAGLCYSSIGTDNGGSIRVPSQANGIVGLKPTYGRVSRHGVFPAAQSLDCIGPMARCVLDAAVVFNAIAVADPRDPTSVAGPSVDAHSIARAERLDGLRVGVDWSWATKRAAVDVADAFTAAIANLVELGAEQIDVTMPPQPDSLVALMAVEATHAHRQLRQTAAASSYGPILLQMFDYGDSTTAVDLFDLQIRRWKYRSGIDALFDGVDVIVAPVALDAGLTLQRYAELFSEPNFMMDRLSAYNAVFNQSGHPSLAVPCGVSHGGAPIAMQLVGRYLDEELLLRVGNAYEQSTDWHSRHPPVA
jgi:amidase